MRNSHATYQVHFFRRLIFMVADRRSDDGNPSVLYQRSGMTSVTYQTPSKAQKN